jgi:HEAT repeat protein
MSRSSAVEQMISQLASVRANPSAPDAKEIIARALESKVGYVAERAAAIAGELKLDVTPALVRAFDRFMRSSDQACGAKTAIAKSLYELGSETPEVFLAGVRHVQHEPGFGGPVDVAAALRGVCALGLVRIAHRDAMLYVTDLLADPQPQARIVAARACAYSERDEAALLLRLKIRHGDREPEVIAECITAIMKLSPQKSLELVGECLDERDEMIRESAALALGESRRREAFELLRDKAKHTPSLEKRRHLLLAIAICRLPEAIAYLLSLVAEEDVASALAAVEALKIYRSDEKIQSAIKQAAQKRGDQSLQREVDKMFA